VVVADGARSALRPAGPPVRRARAYPWAALWCVVPDPENRFGSVLSQVYRGTRRMIGFLPSGRPHPYAPEGDRTVSVFWSLPAGAHERVRAAGLDAWKREVRDLTGLAEPVLELVRDWDQLLFAAYHDVVLRPLHAGPVVYLGDAGHAMSPQLGQGANLALVDAAALADALADHPTLPAALAAFSRLRSGNVGYYQRASRWLTPFFQSSRSWLAGPRDLLMGPLCRLPWTRRQMLLSLVGVKTGVLGAGPVPSLPHAARIENSSGTPEPIAGLRA
jgi:2-polyprenyl-6-methoxyphenol hydroxylase-like FAD-dependent oxidoreductase